MAELPLIINQAVGTAWTIASSISKLISTCRDAPASITLADRQCVAVRGQLAMLQSLMLDETWSQRAERSRIDFSYFVGTIIDCAETLMELEECLNKINGGIDTHNSGSRAPRVGPQQMLRYQWVKHDLERLGALLQVSRDSIGPILGVLQM